MESEFISKLCKGRDGVLRAASLGLAVSGGDGDGLGKGVGEGGWGGGWGGRDERRGGLG